MNSKHLLDDQDNRFSIFLNQCSIILETVSLVNQKRFPLFLLLGPKQSGKTLWMENSAYPYLKKLPESSVQSHSQNINESNEYSSHDYCKWWLTENAIFLEIPSDWIFYENQKLFKKITCYLAKHVYFEISGIILFFSLECLNYLSFHILQKQLPKLENALNFIRQSISKTLFQYTIITQMDKIKGFDEYFFELKADERKNILGIDFSEKNNVIDHLQYSLIDSFNKSYPEFIHKLNLQLLSNLHHSFSIEKKLAMIDFPLQFEYLNKNITFLIQEILQKFQFSGLWLCSGIYFTCSKISNEKVNLINGLESFLNEKLFKSDNVEPKKASYFIHELFLDINYLVTNGVKKSFSWKEKLLKQRLHFAGFLSITLLLSGYAYFLSQSYFSTKIIINHENYVLSQLDDEISSLSPLNANYYNDLNLIFNAFNNIKNLSLKPSIFFSTNFHKQVKNTEKKLFEKVIVPQIQLYLENKLQQDLVSPQERFNSLSIYLMLTNKKDFDKNKIEKWLKSQNNNSNIQDSISKKIISLTEKMRAKNEFVFNAIVVDKARKKLIKTIPSELIFELMLNQKQQKLQTIFNHFTINSYFTIFGFKNYFLPQLENLDPFIKQYQSVLSNTVVLQPNEIKSELVKIYFKNYVLNWQNLFYQINHDTKKAPITIGEEIYYIKSLQDYLKKISPIITTELSPYSFVSAAATSYTQDHFLNQIILIEAKDSINPFVSNIVTHDSFENTNSSSQILQISLQSLINYLQALTPDKAFLLAHDLIENSASNPFLQLQTLINHQLTPINNQLAIICNQGYEIIFHMASDYINSKWQNEVLPIWNVAIQEKYPIDKTAANEISLADFKTFFGTNGTLDQFYKHYLASFINTSGERWSLKTFKNHQLKISSLALLNFERARIIREMFFPNEADYYSVRFTMIPQDIDSLLMSVDLNINGQTLVSHPRSDETAQFTWPGPYKTPTANLVFYDVNQKTSMLNTTGPWALFKLIDEGQLLQTNQSQKFMLTFKINQMTVKYNLVANNPINPFIPGILQTFKCPTNLLG